MGLTYDGNRILADGVGEEVMAVAKSRVVVVEDEPEMSEIIQLNLERAGFDVVRARDGVEALELLECTKCDAMVLDLGLPKMSGFRVATLLRRDPKWEDMPVVVVTASDFEEVEDIADRRIQGFITKPFVPSVLVSEVRYALSGKDCSGAEAGREAM